MSPPRPPGLHLRLYVAGQAPNSNAARVNLRTVLDAAGLHALAPEVVDVLEEPERAAVDRVLLTPMLLKLSPPPVCRIVGSLADHGALCTTLGLVLPPR